MPGKDLSLSLKKEWARELYARGEHTQKEICQKIDVSEQAMSRWVNEGTWDKERRTLMATKKELLNSFYIQLELLNKANQESLEDDDPDTNPNYDAVIKLVNSIKKLENQTGVGEMIDTLTRLIKFIQPEDLDFAKNLTTWSDLFIQSALKAI